MPADVTRGAERSTADAWLSDLDRIGANDEFAVRAPVSEDYQQKRR
jgi:hypothetical protein